MKDITEITAMSILLSYIFEKGELFEKRYEIYFYVHVLIILYSLFRAMTVFMIFKGLYLIVEILYGCCNKFMSV